MLLHAEQQNSKSNDQIRTRNLRGTVYYQPTDDESSWDQNDVERIGYIFLFVVVLNCACFVFRSRCAGRALATQANSITSHSNELSRGNEESRPASADVRPTPGHEEKKAQLLQWFAPVRLVLEAKHFPRPISSDDDNTTHSSTVEEGQPRGGGEEENDDGAISSQRKRHTLFPVKNGNGTENVVIEIPKPGLHLNRPYGEQLQTRHTSGMCGICLMDYEIGSDIVWSSNPMCNHVYHEQCMENWLMTKQGAPLCPCCRRDFIVDLYDSGEICC